ncbi:hypothetical protein CHLRE_09g398555v5 [Chlamydomonas reinhardtii]|uniref:Uncharacterized protein n=1 Tax=Chlamydomonas reinhardtii TaxID=3055 RepID=A0A2K3DD01_CHLRE|nr:uncharacterized protein CHLRE_09g398554v5 [Chlamydomonas reinhardtii]XP_042920855.1 uncharacterized protein CHLRE_09g398555v5 [Chlamydomonas reinhardtii]PNW78411.1 hypothetical protein CHLRE_09g398554v5 [Chlamydomonas reinhardtii]PNW78412.1 hypothetical protein CHLRE_09g398555v5 [Chlamydomonas reinhardtii]
MSTCAASPGSPCRLSAQARGLARTPGLGAAWATSILSFKEAAASTDSSISAPMAC